MLTVQAVRFGGPEVLAARRQDAAARLSLPGPRP